MTNPDNNRVNTIVIFDSIPEGELNTARRIHEDLESYATSYPPSLAIGYVRVESTSKLFQVLEECTLKAARDGMSPLVHIECHGTEDETGICLADGSFVSWLELKPALTDLNVATQLNLMVVMAACNGAALATAISLTDRAPFWGFIGPTKPLSSAALLSAYGAFYRELLSTKSPSKAVVALEAHSDHDAFWRATAQGVFETVWKGYLKEYCAPDRLKERILHMRSRFHEHTGILAEPELLEQMLRQSEPQSFARFLSTYFMHDLYPLHIQRFDIPYIGLASSHVA